jgi:ribosomal protein S18 acetylase RimI-like enzyme
MQFEAALARIGEEDKLIPPARWHLKYVAVDPAFQRRGVGALLVRAGMERAREEGVPVMLEASPNGEKLYEKLGFVVVGEMLLRGAGVGGPVMRWDPPTSEDENGAIA